ncbi:hypothetical protein [Pseudophaeobacter sp.]
MKKKSTIMGQVAPNPRLTKTAAFLVATGLSIPVFVLLSLLDWLFL